MKRAIVTPDKHFPFEDKPAIKVLCKAIELVKPDIYIDLGDCLLYTSDAADE